MVHAQPPSLAAPARGRMFLIEDDTCLAALLVHTAEDHGLHVTHAADARETVRLSALAEQRPDVIVVDHGLPDTTGDMVVRWMRELFGEEPRVIGFSAATDPGVAGRMLEAGCDAFLDKGTGLDALLELIDELLAATPEARRVELRARYQGHRA